MNIIGIDVSQGESHATLITKEAEEIAFKFKHNKSGSQILNSYIKPGTIIFETTGVYSAQRDCKIVCVRMNDSLNLFL